MKETIVDVTAGTVVATHVATLGELQECMKVPGPPAADGYIIRIVEPRDVVSSMETRVYRSVEETETPIAQLTEKLTMNGVDEYLIYVIDQSTGKVVNTLRRRVQKSFVTEKL